MAVLAVLDVLLGHRQKERLSDLLARLWNKLDEQQKSLLVNWLPTWLSTSRAQVRFAAVLGLMPIAAYLLSASSVFWTRPGNPDNIFAWTALLSAFIGTLLFGPLVLKYLLQSKSQLNLLLRGGISLGGSIAVGFALILSVWWFVDETVTDKWDRLAIGAGVVFLPAAIVCALIFVVCFSTVRLLLVVVMRYLLAAVELVVRRVVEYPKGPILAISVLLGSIAATLKAFGIS